MKNKKKMNAKESLNSKINKKSASEVASKAGISLQALRERAKNKGIVATKISNINYYNHNQAAILTQSKVVRSKKDALICDLCEKFPSISDEDLSEIVGLKVSRPQFFIFKSKMNKL